MRQHVERLPLLHHVVLPVAVPRLDPSEAVRLHLPAYLAADSIGSQQRFHAGPNTLEPKAVDRVASDRSSCVDREVGSSPVLREPLIPFGSSGCVALFA